MEELEMLEESQVQAEMRLIAASAVALIAIVALCIAVWLLMK